MLALPSSPPLYSLRKATLEFIPLGNSRYRLASLCRLRPEYEVDGARSHPDARRPAHVLRRDGADTGQLAACLYPVLHHHRHRYGQVGDTEDPFRRSDDSGFLGRAALFRHRLPDFAADRGSLRGRRTAYLDWGA